ncbi:MAG: alginate lyase family protein [Fibrobacteres bacterium]|nr:alginate lyase family protein [Fibrobacterota bacterium]
MHRITSLLAGILLCASPSAAAMTFTHPGGVDGKAELDFVKAKVKAGAQPWTAEYAKVRTLSNRGPSPLEFINSSGNDANLSRDDAKSAYANALLWSYSGDEMFAKRSIDMLNAWSILQGFNAGTEQDRLQAGWIGALFAPAAEIMLGYPGWSAQDIENFRAMFKRAFYPQLNTASTWNGNVDLTQIDAMMNIAVFNEDETEFNLGLHRLQKRNPAYFYLSADGGIPSVAGDGNDSDKFWSSPAKWVDGLTQESCRDQGHHSQFALASALRAAEVAWHQGVDVYTENTARYTAALELLGTQIATGDMQGTCATNTTTADRYSTFEIGYNHYHNRKGIELPNTLKAITQEIRPKGKSDWNIFYETLTHGDLGELGSTIPLRRLGRSVELEATIREGSIVIRTSIPRTVTLSVRSTDGKELKSQELSLEAGASKTVEILTADSPRGLYLVCLRSADQRTTLKVVR